MKKLLLLIALLIAAIPAAAQETTVPLIIRHYDTSLLIYDGTEVQRMAFCVPEDGDSYSGFPLIFSPDAARFAYIAFTGSGNLTHIYVCDLQEQALIPVEGQDAEKIRSTPVLSISMLLTTDLISERLSVGFLVSSETLSPNATIDVSNGLSLCFLKASFSEASITPSS